MKKKVMYLLPLVEGGIKKHVLMLMENLKDHYNFYLACPPAVNLDKKLTGKGIKLYSFPGGEGISPVQDLKNVLALCRILKKERIDLLHLHGYRAGYLGRLASCLSPGLPVVFTVHNFMAYPEKSRFPFPCFYALENIMSRKTAKIITVSEALKENLTVTMGIPPEKVIKIYNGIEEKSFAQAGGKSVKGSEPGGNPGVWPGGAGNLKIVGTAAHLAPQKGIGDFIQAVPLVLKENQEVRFMIAGKGPLEASLKKEARHRGVEAHIDFVGYISDMWKFLSSLDVFVLPSRSEGLSLTLLEALAAGRPVVATQTGGVPEIIKEGINGYLVPPGDYGALAKKITGLLVHPRQGKLLGERGRQIIQENFTVEGMIEKTRSLYEELLRGG